MLGRKVFVLFFFIKRTSTKIIKKDCCVLFKKTISLNGKVWKKINELEYENEKSCKNRIVQYNKHWLCLVLSQHGLSIICKRNIADNNTVIDHSEKWGIKFTTKFYYKMIPEFVTRSEPQHLLQKNKNLSWKLSEEKKALFFGEMLGWNELNKIN